MKLKSQYLLAFVVFSQATQAAVVEKANNTDPLNTPASWVGAVAPTDADIASFDTTYATTGILTAGATIDWAGVKVGDPGGAVVVTNTSVNKIVLGASGVDLSTAADNLSIQHLGVSAIQTWNIGADRTFTVGGAAADPRKGTLSLFDVGTATITKSGPGTVVLDTANNSVGAIDWNITGGVIRAIWNNPGAFGPGTITLGGGGIATGTPYTGSVGNWTWNNPIVLTNATDSFIDNQNIAGTERTLGLTGNISGAGSLTFRNTGGDIGMVFTLAGNNTYSGGTTINGGTVLFNGPTSLPTTGLVTVNTNGAVGGAVYATVQEWLGSGRISTASTGSVAISANSAAAIDFSAAGYNSLGLAATGGFTYSGILTPGTGGYKFGGGKNLTVTSELSAPTTLTKNGGATAIISRDANGYTGGTTVNGGELQAVATTAAGAKTTLGTGPITVNTGTRLRFKTGSTSNALSYPNAINLNAATLISEDGVVTYNGPITVTGVNTINVVYGAKDAIFASTLTGSGSVAKTGAGALHFLAAGNQIAALEVSQGKIILEDAASLTIDGQYRSSTSSNKGSLSIAANAVVNTDSIFSSWGTDMLVNGTLNVTNTLTFSGGVSTVTGTGTINTKATDNTTGRNITLTGVLNGTGGITKTGAGTLTLKALNEYTGATTVTGGTLALAGGKQASAITVASGASLGVSAETPTTSTSTVDFAVGATVTIIDAPPAPGSHTLLTATAITGTPTLSPGVTGFTLAVENGGTTLVLKPTSGDDFATWIGGFTFAPGADTSPTGDPDGDGLTNREEYAFGLAPNSGASVNPITAPLNMSTGLFTYTRRLPSVTGITYSYEYSTNLATWTAFTPDATTSDSGNPVEAVTVDVPNDLLTNPKLFVRVRAD